MAKRSIEVNGGNGEERKSVFFGFFVGFVSPFFDPVRP